MMGNEEMFTAVWKCVHLPSVSIYPIILFIERNSFIQSEMEFQVNNKEEMLSLAKQWF